MKTITYRYHAKHTTNVQTGEVIVKLWDVNDAIYAVIDDARPVSFWRWTHGQLLHNKDVSMVLGFIEAIAMSAVRYLETL